MNSLAGYPDLEHADARLCQRPWRLLKMPLIVHRSKSYPDGITEYQGDGTVIEYKTGDIFREDTEALVNTVNCVGVMGRGIALQFKRIFPENFKAYAARCKRAEIRPGHMYVFETGETVNPRYIINFPTKRHWRGKSRIGDIESGLASLAEEVRARGIRSIAIPPLGSGLGGLDWSKVRTRMNTALNDLGDVRVVIFEPGGDPEPAYPISYDH